MQRTISRGTARKTFRNQKRDKVLRKLVLGGKTGTIYNTNHDARIDWFVGFAKEKQGDERLAVSVVVAHEEYIGTRAGEYAKLAFKTYFKNVFAKETSSAEGDHS